VLRRHRPAQRAPTGRVRGAGTETADYWLGDMAALSVRERDVAAVLGA
jgi:monoamine oxidase